jgi:hypothetical protein
MAKHHRRLTEAERDERRARDRERLKQACEQLLSSDGWQRWVRARARNGLARYSVSNLCLILLANPHASFVAGFKAWLELGYGVRKGEHAIWLFAPMPTRRRDSDPAAETDEEQRRVLFRAVPVFDTLSRDPGGVSNGAIARLSSETAGRGNGRGGAGEELRRGDEPVPPRAASRRGPVGRCRAHSR